MKVLSINRRQFLVGAGGFTLALPFLGSLYREKAKAGDAPYAKNPRFVCFATQHGGIWASNFFPADSTLTETGSVFSDHAYRHGPLTAAQSNGRAAISPVLSAPSDRLTADIVSKMMVLRGLDITFYINHHTGGFLGNYARNDSEGSLGLEYIPTIDQVMAWSPTFYPDIDFIRERSIHVGNGMSWGYSNPSSQSGSVQALPGAPSSSDLFNRIFIGGEPTSADDSRTLVVDRVYEHYDAVRNGAFGDSARLSAEDRRRLDDHMDRLAELQRRLTSGGVAGAMCTSDLEPGLSVGDGHPGITYETRNVEATVEYYQTFNDVIAAAFICGTSRIATVYIGQHVSADPRSWHDQIAHRGTLSTANPGEELPQTTLANAQRRVFEDVFLDLARKLNYEEANGVTYLDNSLLMFTQESGCVTHDADSMPLVTAGSAAGYFRTGRYYDYRNRASTGFNYTSPAYVGERRPGLTYNQWLANVLQSMNVPPSQYERNGLAGYGLHFRGSPGAAAWPDRIYDFASDPLPGIRVAG